VKRQSQLPSIDAEAAKIYGYAFGHVEMKYAPEVAYLLDDWRSGRPPHPNPANSNKTRFTP
jgi:hypothetical protein